MVEVLENAGVDTCWAALPNETWQEELKGSSLEEARRIYNELETERQESFQLRLWMRREDADEEDRRTASVLSSRFQVHGAQAAIRSRDAALIDGVDEKAMSEALAAP